MAEDALKGADAADRALAAGTVHGLLHGLAFSFKDALDTADDRLSNDVGIGAE